MNMLHLLLNFLTRPPNKRFASFWRFCKWNWVFSIGWNIFYFRASKRGKIETQKLDITNWMRRCSWTFIVAWRPWASRFSKSFVSTFQSLENILWIESVKELVAKSQTSFFTILANIPHIRQNHSTFLTIAPKIHIKQYISTEFLHFKALVDNMVGGWSVFCLKVRDAQALF